MLIFSNFIIPGFALGLFSLVSSDASAKELQSIEKFEDIMYCNGYARVETFIKLSMAESLISRKPKHAFGKWANVNPGYTFKGKNILGLIAINHHGWGRIGMILEGSPWSVAAAIGSETVSVSMTKSTGKPRWDIVYLRRPSGGKIVEEGKNNSRLECSEQAHQ